MRSRKLNGWKKLLGGALILSGTSACGTPHSAINDYCLIYEPIQASRQDTQGTLNQVFKENGKYICLCKQDCPQE